MTEIFISYASHDRSQAAELAAFLQEKGYSVWWDRELIPGDQFNETIRKALDSCRAVIVIWTDSSIESRWVLGEAETAAAAQKLIPVRSDTLDPGQLPIGFRALHTVPLSDRSRLLGAITAHLIAPKQPSRWQIAEMRWARRWHLLRQTVTSGRLVAAAVFLAVCGYFGANFLDWMSIRDSMEPADFSRHLEKFPVSLFASKARAKLAGADEWGSIKTTKDMSELQEFSKAFPTSIYSEFARVRLSRLKNIAGEKYKPVFTDSVIRPLGPNDLQSLSCDQLWTARNEIYYALGYCFVTDAGIERFQTSADCPTNCRAIAKINSEVEQIFSKTEVDNIHAILSLEEQRGCRKSSVPSACARRR
jgi:TIR domain-containing protein/YARHG domain-containing protein